MVFGIGLYLGALVASAVVWPARGASQMNPSFLRRTPPGPRDRAKIPCRKWRLEAVSRRAGCCSLLSCPLLIAQQRRRTGSALADRLIDAITHKAVTFEQVQFLLLRLTPTDFVFLCEKSASCCYLPRRFWFRRSRFSERRSYAKWNKCHENHKSNRNMTHQPGLHERGPWAKASPIRSRPRFILAPYSQKGYGRRPGWREAAWPRHGSSRADPRCGRHVLPTRVRKRD